MSDTAPLTYFYDTSETQHSKRLTQGKRPNHGQLEVDVDRVQDGQVL